MGNRVLVQFEDKTENEISPVVYMHWSGEEAPEYIRELAELMKGRDGDLQYAAARFVGVAHSRISGNLSLGVWNQSERLTEGDTHGDAGCYVVDVNSWDVDAFGGYGKTFNARAEKEDAA